MGITYRKIQLNKLTREDNDRIGEFLRSSNQSTVFHTVEWNTILSDILLRPQDSLYVIYAERNGELCGYYPILLKKIINPVKGVFSPQSAYETPYGGPVYGKDMDVCQGLIRRAEKNILVQSIDIFSPPGSDCSFFGKMGYEMIRWETIIVNLETGEEELWNNMESRGRRAVRKARKNDIEVLDIDQPTNEQIAIYHEMIQATMGEAAKSREFYGKVIRELVPKGMAKFFLVRYDGHYIAGSIGLCYNDTYYYWNGASNREFMKLGSNNLLHWDMIKWARDNGYIKYDFVKVDRERLPGIAKFKLGWGGDIVECHHLMKRKWAFKLAKIFRR